MEATAEDIRAKRRERLFSRRSKLECNDQAANARKAALLPGWKIDCLLSPCAEGAAVNFSRRGGPEPDGYYFKGWSHEQGEFVPALMEATPEEEAEAAEYEKRWEASLDARYAEVLHALCAAIERAPHEESSGFPEGFTLFSLPEDRAPEKPPVVLVAWCEQNPDEAQSAFLLVDCYEESYADVVPLACVN